MNTLDSIVKINSLDDISLPDDSVLITDEKIGALYPLNVQRKILIPSGEKAKRLSVAEYCWNEMHRMGISRQSTVIAMGGGTVTDLGGFVAAAYMRGIDFVNIPTTLLGMVDAAIGGKTGLNLDSGKSLVGAFHLPQTVYLCPSLLNSLPPLELKSGMAEVIKYGVIADAPLFEQLEADQELDYGDIILRCAQIKSSIVKQDLNEKGVRAILNYGHTFGHAIETLTGYQRFAHGEAIAIGMHLAAKVSEVLGWVDQHFVQRQKKVLEKFNLPIELPKELSANAMISQMKRDKKATGGRIALILPKKIGTVAIYICQDDHFLHKVIPS